MVFRREFGFLRIDEMPRPDRTAEIAPRKNVFPIKDFRGKL